MTLMSTMDVNGSSNYALSYSVLILFNLMLQTFVLYKTIGLVNFFYAFVVFYYVFHFGQIIMLGIFPWYEYDYVNYVETYMTRHMGALKDTLVLCINCINIFVLGALLVRKPQLRSLSNKISRYNYRAICKVVFIILFSFRVLLDAIALYISFYLGYSGTWESFLPGVVSALGIMGFGVIPLYYFSIEDKKQQKRFLLFITAYLLLTMLSGNRGHQMTCIVGLLIVYLTINKPNVKSLLLLGVLGFFGLQFVDFIFDLRAEGLNAYLNSGMNKEVASSSNIFLETIGTFGETIFTPFLVLENYKSVDPFWGECFVKSIAAIVPDITGGLRDINDQAVFAKMIKEGHTIGGSFAGEMYYNFGNTYYLPTLLIGMIYASLSNKVSCYVKLHRIDMVYMSLPICVLFLWWVRDSIGNMTREIVWLWILFAIMKVLYKKKKR